MPTTYSPQQMLSAIAFASRVLEERKEEVNRLNVFPVPDGDTGTNMSLTIKSVVDNIQSLSADANNLEVLKAITTGALMGARGNSGVITSQILRGFCEGTVGHTKLSTEVLHNAFAKAEEVAFQAVRKPVEGTILTVLRDSAAAAAKAHEDRLTIDDALEAIVAEAYASVQRTPDFLPVLKENGVVDAGGFGLAILFDAFTASLLGKGEPVGIAFGIQSDAAPKVEIEQINDWEDANFRYCNEFLVDSDTLDISDALDFLATMGDCELCVGSTPKFKVHVHSNEPNKVLEYFLNCGQISEVHIHNMELQSADRAKKIANEEVTERKPIGVVAVANGSGNVEILKSLGVDKVVSGGQTMNPSTKDLLDAANSVNANAVVFLPNNSNIIMAAHSACELSDKSCGVVPTKSVPQAFGAMFALDSEVGLEENIEAMSEAAADVLTGEVTTAVKDSKDADGNPIKTGDVIGISDGSICAVGSDVANVIMDLLAKMNADDYDTCTLLAGDAMTDNELHSIAKRIEDAYCELEVDAQRGDQPLYPMVLSLE
ncbi:DAK2 domain-containing protein [Adlercreutzia sp. ZJ154]|uniref:DAK2 domain-containing protein n=1 Tax=Adlercreutzia sp. ZJ154 TaxID=2709790 RepID=UPI0013EDFCF5|nr:DAK2 domain-containing protein [Adlercreutzia sp. ZJ154]